MAGPPSGSRTGGRPGYGAGGDGPAAVPAAADRTERVRRPGGGQAGKRPLRLRQEDLPEREGPETLAAVWYGRAAEAEDQHGTLVACYNGFGALPGGFAAVEESLARWAGRPLGEKLLDYVQAVRREEGDLAEKAEPFQTLPSWTDRETGELLRALLRALCEGSGGRGSAQG